MGFIDVGKEEGLEQSEKTNKSLAATRANRETTKETPPPSLLTMFERTWKYDQKGKRFSAENNTNKKHYIDRKSEYAVCWSDSICTPVQFSKQQ